MDVPQPAPATVTRSVALDVDGDAAWHLVGTPSGLASWLGDDVEVDPVPGGALRLRDDDGTTRVGTVLDVQLGRSLSLRWAVEGEDAASEVTISVTGDGDGRSRVTVTETLATTGGRTLARADAGVAWEGRLLGLELAALAVAPAFAALA